MGDSKKVIDKVNQFMDKIKMHGKEIRLEGDDCPCIIKQKLYNGNSCRNPSFGLATKTKGVARVRATGKPESHIRDSRECRKV
jgi:hypothetical protein